MKSTLHSFWLTALLMLLSQSLFAYDFEVNGIYYKITSSTDLTVSVTYKDVNYNSYSGNVSIPSTVTYSSKTFSVTAIEKNAFSGCPGLTSIDIPNSVTRIGRGAFSGCFGLTSIAIPSSVIHIGDNAFYGCSGLTSITIPNSVTDIGYDTFGSCTSIKNVNIEDGTNSLSLGYNQKYSNYTYYYYGLFNDCPIDALYLGRDLTYDTDHPSPFENVKSLRSVTIPNNVTSIGKRAFEGCDNLHSLVIGTGVTKIGNNAASSTKVIWLTNTPPEGYKNVTGKVQYVSNNNFTGLTNVKVYPYLSSLFEVDGVKYVPVNPSARTCDAIDCTYEDKDSIVNIGKTVSYRNIAMTINNINQYTAYKNSCIKKVEITAAASIEENAFNWCSSLREVKLSNTGNIGNSAFSGCTSLRSATVNNAGSIGNNAFYNCSKLETCELGDQVTAIGSEVFKYCSSLAKVSLGKNISSIGNSAFYDCKYLKEIVIPDATTDLETSCFSGCSSLEKASIGNGVSSLPSSSFSGCSSLEEVTIGSKVNSINQYAFQYCKSLPSITIPSNVEAIGNNVFSGCSQLANVIIADRKKALSLGSNGSSPLFSGCALDSVYIGGKITYSTSNRSGYSPFYKNTSLRSVVITDEETLIYDNEFYGCTGLKNVKIGDGVQKIGDYAFSGCSCLDYFGFGENMQSIGKEAFSDCSALTRLYSEAAVPPTCGSQALEDINKWNCILYVPKANIAAYQAADQWKDFFFVEANTEYSGIECLTSEDKTSVPVHNLLGHKVTTPTKGKVYIQNGKKYVTK